VSGEDRPGRRELQQMSRRQLVELGGELDGVHVVASTPRLPPDDPRRRRRAERLVTSWFALSVLFAVGFVVAFVAWPHDYVAPGEPGHLRYLLFTPVLGSTFGFAVLTLGIGVTTYMKRFFPDEVAVQQREGGPSDPLDRATAAARLEEAGAETGLGHHGLARRALLAAVAASGAIAGVLAIGTFVRNPWKGGDNAALWVTGWRSLDGETVYLRQATGVSGEIVRVRPEDMAPAAMMTVFPFRESDRGHEQLLDAAEHAPDAPVMLIRFRPGAPIRQRPGQERYHYGDFYAYSKICTHLGCPASLFNAETNISLCPCHQSAFDMTDGAKVVFGPAVRPLPQLPITVNDEGYFVATGDFSQPVGPEFWEIRTA
jgi:ubiquinol-cytochrome c reductase iron-sulfur subunit